MKHLTCEYSVNLLLAGIIDEHDEMLSMQELQQHILARVLGELEELVLKRPDELPEYIEVVLGEVIPVETDEDHEDYEHPYDAGVSRVLTPTKTGWYIGLVDSSGVNVSMYEGPYPTQERAAERNLLLRQKTVTFIEAPE